MIKKQSYRIITILLMLAVAVGVAVSGCAGIGSRTQNSTAQPASPDDGIDWGYYNGRAEAFVIATANGDYAGAAGMFDETMTRVFGAAGLEDAWATVIGIAGDFIRIHDYQNATIDGYYISGVIMQHENTGFGWNVVFSEDSLIAGLNTGGTMPLPDSTPYSHPLSSPAIREGFTDYPVIVGEGSSYPLNGILSMPDNAAGQIPAVVIVQGSGSRDMDGTISGSKPYRDIADYLAASGIAVLRNDKRTFVYGAKMLQEHGGSLTVWDEAIEDAIIAAQMLKADPRIDENKVFIIGHSLGAIIAPRIHVEGGSFAGLILLAGSPRTLSEILLDQSMMQLEQIPEGPDRTLGLAQLEELTELLASIPAMNDEEAKAANVIGMSGYYLNDMSMPPFSHYAGLASVPMLVMQGGRDFQILPDKDYAMLQELLGSRKTVTFKLYDDLNHLFILTTAMSFAEHAESIMQTSGQMDTQVLQDISDWILNG